MRICNPEGTVRAVVAADVDCETAEEIIYTLDPGSAGDFAPGDHIFAANVMWKRKTIPEGTDEAVFRVGVKEPKVASVHTATSPVVELAEAVRQACWDSTCSSPFVVMCNVDPSKVDCAASLGENVSDKPLQAGQTDMRHRACATWCVLMLFLHRFVLFLYVFTPFCTVFICFYTVFVLKMMNFTGTTTTRASKSPSKRLRR